MNYDDFINHYQDTRKDVLKTKNWKIYIQIMFDKLKAPPIPDPKPDPEPIQDLII